MFEPLIEYLDLNEASEEMFGFGQVAFKQDFGPWKRGDKVDSLWFMLDKGVVEEQSDDGIVVKGCKFALAAIPGTNYTDPDKPAPGEDEDEDEED